ncbi:hypothetical protein [Methanosarcina sp. Kolksee]|nr:hypothetical protein [Methanosarcina sp. Kolksee]
MDVIKITTEVKHKESRNRMEKLKRKNLNGKIRKEKLERKN